MLRLRFKGGPGSGFHGHKGRPGQVGGSSSVDFSMTQYAQNHREVVDKQIEWMANYNNMSVEDYKSSVQASLSSILDDSQVAVRVTQSALESILTQGEIKSVFETKSSTAFQNVAKNKYLDMRREFEQEVFGIDSAQKSGRPIYGYITQKDDGRADSTWLEPYGDVAVYMNDDVRNRTTFTDSDSLDDAYQLNTSSTGIEYGRAYPSSITNPSIYSSLGNTLGTDMIGALKDKNYMHPDTGTYWEAQIHGGVTLSNISKIVFTKYPPSESVASRLNDLGIPWYVVEN